MEPLPMTNTICRRNSDPAVYEARIRTHRAEYINERDFATIKSWGLNSVRIPVPYFIFGDRAPFIGCIDELDKAFNWAEKYGLTILIDLHTAPMSQNGFDNGGISGVCKWARCPTRSNSCCPCSNASPGGTAIVGR